MTDEERKARRREYSRRYREMHPEKVKEYYKRYREKHRAEDNARHRIANMTEQQIAERRAKVKAYYEKNRDYLNAKQRERYAKDPEKFKRYHDNYVIRRAMKLMSKGGNIDE